MKLSSMTFALFHKEVFEKIEKEIYISFIFWLERIKPGKELYVAD